MKTFFLLSDITVIILALIPSVFGVIMLLVQAGINAKVKRVELLQKIRNARTEEGIEKIDQIAEKQDIIHKQIDGRMEDLIKTTAELGEAVGVQKGKEEQKAKMAPIIEEKVKAAKDAGKIEGIEQANGGG